MGWFDRKPKWDGPALLASVASLAGVSEPAVKSLVLTGRLHGLALEVAIDEDGCLRRVVLAHASLPDRLELCRDDDPDESGPRIDVGKRVFVRGPHADRQAAAFWALPEALQHRVPAEMHRLEISELESERKRLVIGMSEQPHAVTEPARWLADALLLGADLARARGARPAEGPPRPGLAAALAPKLAARIPGSTIVARDTGLAITWSDASIVLGGNDLSIEVRGEDSEALAELFAQHELRAMTFDDELITFIVCDLDEVTDDGASACRIADELVRVLR